MNNDRIIFLANSIIYLLLFSIIAGLLILVTIPGNIPVNMDGDTSTYPPVSQNKRLIMAALFAVPALLAAKALFSLKRVFTGLVSASLFSSEVEHHMLTVAKSLIAAIIAMALVKPFIGSVVTGTLVISVGFSSSTLVTILLALLLYLFAKAIAVGRAQQDELKRIV